MIHRCSNRSPPPLPLTTDMLAELMEPGTQAVLGVPSAGGTCGRCPEASSQCPSVVGITSSPHSAEEPTGTGTLSEPRGQRTSLSPCLPVQRTGEAILGAGLNLPASEAWFPKQRWPSSAEVMGGAKDGAQVFVAINQWQSWPFFQRTVRGLRLLSDPI